MLDQLTDFCDEMADLVDEGKALDIVYLDVDKTFDTVTESESQNSRGWKGPLWVI